ncbi:MAG TPA: 4-hydroxybenzoate 3-monooxygenase [Gaiellaceae bacterium]|nr:4-hydroxybenzoate 3-monooxygenase [Gaiellaceae bacterium]
MGIVGAGPAGLMIGNLLRQRGIDCIVLDKHTRAETYARSRAGFIEWRNKLLLEEAGVATRMLAEGEGHGRCEFRSHGHRHILDYSELAGGRTHWVYPQHELVADMADAYVEAGGDLRDGLGCVSVLDHGRPRILCSDGRELDCELLAGCDGFHGAVRPSFPEGTLTEHTIDHGWQWLAVLVDAPPSSDHLIYALHENGFAAHMMRSPHLCRYYLQCAPGDTVDDWPDDRIWWELSARLAADGFELEEGPIIDRSTLILRSVVFDPMQYKQVLLAGDAAHVITPCGAKGMNLALQDAALIAELAERYLGGEQNALAEYTERRLPDVWRSQEFSHWMLHMLHNYEPGEGSSFLQGLQSTRLRNLEESPEFARHFALAYVGAE